MNNQQLKKKQSLNKKNQSREEPERATNKQNSKQRNKKKLSKVKKKLFKNNLKKSKIHYNQSLKISNKNHNKNRWQLISHKDNKYLRKWTNNKNSLLKKHKKMKINKEKKRTHLNSMQMM